MRTLTCLSTFCIAVCWVPSSPSEIDGQARSWQAAYVSDDKIWSVDFARNEEAGLSDLRLIQFTNTKESDSPKGQTKYQIPKFDDGRDFLRWKWQETHLWVLSTPSQFNARLFLIDLADVQAYANKLNNDSKLPRIVDIPWDKVLNHHRSLMPLDRLLDKLGFNAMGGPRPTGVFHDYLPYTNDDGAFFILEKGRLRTWQVGRKNRVDYGWLESESETIAADFAIEPFQAFGTVETYYFITESGKIYVSDKPQKGARTFRNWAGRQAADPVSAIIVDNDTKKHHVFTTRGNSTASNEIHYFDLKDVDNFDKYTRFEIKGDVRETWLSPNPEVRMPYYLRYLAERKLIQLK